MVTGWIERVYFNHEQMMMMEVVKMDNGGEWRWRRHISIIAVELCPPNPRRRPCQWLLLCSYSPFESSFVAKSPLDWWIWCDTWIVMWAEKYCKNKEPSTYLCIMWINLAGIQFHLLYLYGPQCQEDDVEQIETNRTEYFNRGTNESPTFWNNSQPIF